MTSPGLYSTGPGQKRNPLRPLWVSMLQRCEDTRNARYSTWGGKGIRVCDRWHDFALFCEDIEAAIGPRPENPPGWDKRVSCYSLDRINTYGDYEPGNVRWATTKEQNPHRRTVRDLEAIIMWQAAEIERLRGHLGQLVGDPRIVRELLGGLK